MNCLNCGKETKNPKFCCKSCAASVNNKLFPKRKTEKVCKSEGCGCKTKSWRHDYCEDHWVSKQRFKYKGKTIGEYRNKLSVAGKHPSWINSHIRNFARSWLKHLTILPCAKCGYELHVELAHVRAVSDFSDDELLSDVNSADNVVQLCPNCHWEFDNLDRNNFWQGLDTEPEQD